MMNETPTGPVDKRAATLAQLRDFEVLHFEPVCCFWGGGHTLETDPTRKGWRCHPASGRNDLWVVGRRGKPGCASIQVLTVPRALGGGEKLDVALYVEEPKEIDEGLHEGRHFDAYYLQFDPYPGVGLVVIRAITWWLRELGLPAD